MRIRYSITVALSSTDAEDKDLGNRSYEVVADSPTWEGGIFKAIIPAAAVKHPVVLPVGGTTGSMFVLRAKTTDPTLPLGIVYPFDTAVAPAPPNGLAMKPLPGALESHALLTSSGPSSALAVTNPGAEIELTVAFAGSAT
jgi:hypothetical protein